MANFSDEFVALVCPQCGGKVELSQAVIDECFIESNGDYIYIGKSDNGNKAKCKFCDTEFIRKQQVKVSVDMGSGSGTRIINTGSGAFIQGSVNTFGGDFVGGNKVVTVIRR